MATSEKILSTADLLEVDEYPALKILDRTDEVFLEAFCELLDIEGRRSGDPILVFPTGPVTYH